MLKTKKEIKKIKRIQLFDQLKNDIQKVTKIDVRKKTNNQIYVEYRSVFIQIINLIYDLKSCVPGNKNEINQSNTGEYLNIDHATVLHSLKQFKLYMSNSKHGIKTLYVLMKEKYHFLIPENMREYDRQKEIIYLKELAEKMNNKLAEIIRYDLNFTIK